MASIDEQETTVTGHRKNGGYVIYSADPVHLNKLRKDKRAVETKTGEDWAQFEVSAADFDPITGFKRKSTMSDEHKQAAAERLKALRNQRNAQ